nr:MAG TPA: hypothetical protein [Caudoviricetes sp.]DAU65867.1 MAG TPA: hypothetical protein [Caudoviricetes sp.]
MYYDIREGRLSGGSGDALLLYTPPPHIRIIQGISP